MFMLRPKKVNQYILRDYKTTSTLEEMLSKLHGKDIFKVMYICK